MAVEILVHCFVAAAMEGEIVLIGIEAGERAEDEFGRRARLLVDAGLDCEVVHRLHAAGADLEDSENFEGRRCGPLGCD